MIPLIKQAFAAGVDAAAQQMAPDYRNLVENEIAQMAQHGHAANRDIARQNAAIHHAIGQINAQYPGMINMMKFNPNYAVPEAWKGASVADKLARVLSYKAREDLGTGSFAIPSQRKYPIHDERHARNALARVSAYGTSSEKAQVRAAVHSRYPHIGEDKK